MHISRRRDFLKTLGFSAALGPFVPFLNRRAVEIDEARIKRRTMPELRKRAEVWYRGREDGAAESRIYHIDLLDPGNQHMSGVTVLSLGSDFGMRRRWDAREMRWSDAEDAWRAHAFTPGTGADPHGGVGTTRCPRGVPALPRTRPPTGPRMTRPRRGGGPTTGSA